MHLTIAVTTVAALLLSQLSVTPSVESARILALLPTASPSLHIWNRSLMLALAARGHHVTVLSPDTEKQPVTNHEDILIEGAYQHVQQVFNYQDMSDSSARESFVFVLKWGQTMCKHNLASEGAQSLMKSNYKFDLIIAEIATEECFLGYVHKFGYPPVMGITAFGSPSWASAFTSSPDNPSYIPNFLMQLTSHMSFYERFQNLLMYSYSLYYREMHHMRYMDDLASKHFGDSLPSLSTIERNMSVVLVNSHFSMDHVRPLVPAMIEVGGMHIQPAKPLPPDLQTYLDEAQDGVIYFSLGSNLRSDQLGSDKITAFLDAFSQLPQRVLWKWESAALPAGLPTNVRLGKWLPQNDILAHPHVRLFITHGGLLSTQEAVHHGVPLVSIPVFMDQHRNAHCAVSRGIGEQLDFSRLTAEGILGAVRKVISSQRYRENAQRLSAQFRDQPQSPLERAVFWTEYVIRHRGAPHLRSPALDITWYQHFLLDVIGLLLLGITAGLVVVGISIQLLLGMRKMASKSKTKHN